MIHGSRSARPRLGTWGKQARPVLAFPERSPLVQADVDRPRFHFLLQQQPRSFASYHGPGANWQDFYGTLGLKKGASAKEIKKAYL